MSSLFYVLSGIITIFFIFLILKSVFRKKKFCVICASISATWIFLLALYFIGNFDDRIILALLIGQSITGIFYLAESKSSKDAKIFRLPFVLTLFTLAYFILQGLDFNSLVLLFLLWVVFVLIYLFRSNKKFYFFVNKLIECCKKW